MKTLRLMGMAVFAVLLSASFMACSSDDDDDSTISSGQVPEGLEAVDIGLGVLWANMNIDATSPYSLGSEFVWGETEVRKGKRTLENYKGPSWSYLTKNKEVLTTYSISGTKYDVAHVKWGNGWRLPTEDEIRALKNHCIRYLSPDSSYVIIKNRYNPDLDSLIIPTTSPSFCLLGGDYYEDKSNVIYLYCYGFSKKNKFYFSMGGGYYQFSGYVRPVKDKY